MSEDVLKNWTIAIDRAEKHHDGIEQAADRRCIAALAAEVRTLRPLAEIGRAFLALPDRTEIWLDHNVPFSAGGVHPILSDERLYLAVCAALGQAPYKSPK